VIGCATGRSKPTNSRSRRLGFAFTVRSGKVAKTASTSTPKHWRAAHGEVSGGGALAVCVIGPGSTANQPWIVAPHAAFSSNAPTITRSRCTTIQPIELIQFARVDAGSIVIDVYPGDGTGPSLSDIVGPEDGSQLRAGRDRPREERFGRTACGRSRRSRPREREVVSADLVAMPEPPNQQMSYGCTCIYHDLHTALIQARGATATHFNRAVYERLKPWVLRHRRPRRAVGAGTSDAPSLHRIDCIPVREEVEAAASYWRGKHRSSRTRTIRTPIKVFDPLDQARDDRFAYRFVKP